MDIAGDLMSAKDGEKSVRTNDTEVIEKIACCGELSMCNNGPRFRYSDLPITQEDHELYPSDVHREKEDYLAGLLPEWSSIAPSDKELYLTRIYKCHFCGDIFPMWWVSKKTWQSTPFRKINEGLKEMVSCEINLGLVVCKRCFEREVRIKPRYFTVNEMVHHFHFKGNLDYHGAKDGEPLFEKYMDAVEKKKRILTDIKDLPTKYEFISSKNAKSCKY